MKTSHKASLIYQGEFGVEEWVIINNFFDYEISNLGRIRSKNSGKILVLYETQSGLTQVGLMRSGIQHHRSVPLLVAKAFLEPNINPFDTPINLDGNRYNNSADNLVWRPRWFAIKYNQQFKEDHPNRILYPIINLKTNEISADSLECAKRYGLIEHDLIYAINNRTYVWPLYCMFDIVNY